MSVDPAEALTPLTLELRKLDLQQGQTLIASVPNHYDATQCDQIQRALVKRIPDGCAVLVMYQGIALEIIG